LRTVICDRPDRVPLLELFTFRGSGVQNSLMPYALLIAGDTFPKEIITETDTLYTILISYNAPEGCQRQRPTRHTHSNGTAPVRDENTEQSTAPHTQRSHRVLFTTSEATSVVLQLARHGPRPASKVGQLTVGQLKAV